MFFLAKKYPQPQCNLLMIVLSKRYCLLYIYRKRRNKRQNLLCIKTQQVLDTNLSYLIRVTKRQ